MRRKQAVRVEAIRADRAAIEFRGLPPATRDELKAALGDKIAVQESDWNCGTSGDPQPQEKAVRRCPGAPRVEPWRSTAGTARRRLPRSPIVRTVGGIVFPGSPLAATKQELEQIAGFWPDIEKSRAEARRLLKEAGAEGLSFELLNRGVDQPYKYVGTWLSISGARSGCTSPSG